MFVVLGNTTAVVGVFSFLQKYFGKNTCSLVHFSCVVINVLLYVMRPVIPLREAGGGT